MEYEDSVALNMAERRDKDKWGFVTCTQVMQMEWQVRMRAGFTGVSLFLMALVWFPWKVYPGIFQK